MNDKGDTRSASGRRQELPPRRPQDEQTKSATANRPGSQRSVALSGAPEARDDPGTGPPRGHSLEPTVPVRSVMDEFNSAGLVPASLWEARLASRFNDDVMGFLQSGRVSPDAVHPRDRPSGGQPAFERDFLSLHRTEARRRRGAPDVAILPVQQGDADGNAHVRGNLGVIREAARASRKVIVIAEEVVPREAIRRSQPHADSGFPRLRGGSPSPRMPSFALRGVLRPGSRVLPCVPRTLAHARGISPVARGVGPLGREPRGLFEATGRSGLTSTQTLQDPAAACCFCGSTLVSVFSGTLSLPPRLD